MINKLRYYAKHPRVLPGKLKRNIFKINKKIYNKIYKIKDKIINKIHKIHILINKYPTVTVVIPTYKKNDYIDEAVNSVLNQNYKPNKIKAILSVNGDDQEYYLFLKEKYKENKNINVVYTKEKGAAHARYFALQFCKTKYITFLDDDDFLTNNYFKELLCKVRRKTKIIISKLYDYENGVLNDKTYINDTISKFNKDLTYDYFDISSLFCIICGKIYLTKYYKMFDFVGFNLNNTEDVWFWVKNVRMLNVLKEISKISSKEGYVRRIISNSVSRSRPNKEKQFDFYILDKIKYIEMYEEELLKDYNDLLAKRFILNKINSQYNMLLNYYKKLEFKKKNEVIELIKNKNIMFFNKSKLGLKRGIAFCHNFPPFIDASSMVASKRLSKISELEDDIISWDVIQANMVGNREIDKFYQMFYAQYQYTNIIRTNEKKAYFNEKSQYLWGKNAFEIIKDNEYDYIYSRSLWAGSHVAASMYKKIHPNAIWYAEFSDPIYKDTSNSVRPVAKKYEKEEAFLNTFWKDLEDDVFINADKIIFTNNNQMKYMTNRIKTYDISNKCLVLNQPVIDNKYCKIINSDYYLDNSKINIGYFGTFYANRNQNDLMTFLKNPNIVMHVFTNESNIKEEKNLKINKQVSNLEFLNIASKMDYLFLNDINFKGNINPYLPSKLADYISTKTPIIAKVYKGTELYKYSNPQIIKTFIIDESFINTLHKKLNNYNTDIINIKNYKEFYTSNSINFEKEAENIINGKVSLGFNLEKINFIIGNKIIWDFDKKIDNENTFYLYYYGLRMIYILTKSYIINGNVKYINLCKKIIKSFYFNYKKIKNKMLYNDHAQAERIENVIFFLSIIIKNNLNNDIEKECIAIIKDAFDKLMKDEYYQKNHNHGIIVDKSLLIALYFLNEKEEKIEYVANRLYEQLQSGFNEDGVHRENSTDYHFTMYENILCCLEVLLKLKYKNIEKFKNKINKIDEYIIYSLKPNLSRSVFGDSKGGKGLPKISVNNDNLKYVLSSGNRGVKPTSLFKYFDSGYIFFREHFEKENYENSTWLSFKAGYTTRIHKHLDDLSICLYTKKHNIFIDPGMYNFVYRDKIKDYMESIPAHSTIFIKNKTYSKASGNGKYFKIIRHQLRKDYDYACAFCNLFDNITIYRNIYYVRNLDCILINDNIYSNEENEYVQYFHLSNDVSLVNNKKDKITLKLKNNNYKIDIKQLNKVDKLNILTGLDTIPYSINTKGFGKYEETKTLEYNKKSNNYSFFTLIDIYNNSKVKVKSFENNIIILEKNNSEIFINIEENTPLYTNIDKVDVKYKNGFLEVINNSNLIYEHTIYVYKSNGEIVKLPYTMEKRIKTKLDSTNECIIMYFIKSKYYETYSGILAKIKEDNTGLKIHQYPHLCIPKIINHCKTNNGLNYKFKVDINYDNICNFKWFVYLNGAQVYSVTNNSDTFEYIFEQDGEYVIIVSVSDKYFKEFDYYEFDKIIIRSK